MVSGSHNQQESFHRQNSQLHYSTNQPASQPASQTDSQTAKKPPIYPPTPPTQPKKQMYIKQHTHKTVHNYFIGESNKKGVPVRSHSFVSWSPPSLKSLEWLFRDAVLLTRTRFIPDVERLDERLAVGLNTESPETCRE